MHAWSRPDVQEIYPLLRRKYLVAQADGSAVIPFKRPSPFFSWDNGFFVALAAEVGDTQTTRAMLDYADRNWSPTWVNGGLHYPRNDDFTPTGAAPAADATAAPADRFVTPRVNTLTGNALLGLARVNVKDGLYTMFNAPWGADHFRQPFLAEVQYPKAYVSRAVWDDRRKALVATIKPASNEGAANAATTFAVGNLTAGTAWTVWINNTMVGEIAGGNVRTLDARHALRLEGGKLRVSAPLEKPINLVVLGRS
jgi:hypothetical protein